jgi:hypothetical protein
MRRRFIPTAAVVGAVWGIYQLPGMGPDAAVDTATLGIIGGTYAIGCGVMIAGTRHWSARGMGLFLTMLGVALRNLATVIWRPDPMPEPVRELSLVCLLVGAALLLFGLAMWIVVWREEAVPGREITS